MPKRGIKPVCVFLIYLIIIIPIYSAGAYAQLFGSVHGVDQVAGFRKPSQDITIINISAKSELTPGAIESNRVLLLDNPAQRFECLYNNVTEYTECETTIAEERAPGQHTYEIQIFNPDMQNPTFPKLMLNFYVDDAPPDIAMFKVTKDAGNVTAEYIIGDRLCVTCPISICAGMKKVRFTYNLQVVGETYFGEGCQFHNNTALNLPPGTSNRRICMEAEDKLGHKTTKCDDFLIDFEAPSVYNASIQTQTGMLKYYDGKPLGNARLEIYFKEDSGMNTSTLKADISSFNSRPEFKEIYQKIDKAQHGRFMVECNNASAGLYKCTINNILLFKEAGNQEPIRAKISIEDIAGNKYEGTIDLPVLFDTTPPLITHIRTGMPDDKGRYWVTPNKPNEIFVDIQEEGSGMSQRKLYLDFSGFGPQKSLPGQITTLQPTNCTEGWTCAYAGVEINTELVNIDTGDVVQVNVRPGSQDDAGNAMGGLTYGAFYYDDQPPEIIDAEMPKTCSSYGDDVVITLTVDEPLSGKVTAEYDARSFSTNYFPQTKECEAQEGGTYKCELTFNDLITVYTKGKINVTLTDLAGNKATEQLDFEVCQSDPGAPPNVVGCFESEDDEYPKPDALDKRVATQIAMPVFLKPSCSTGAEIEDVEITGCTLAEGGTAGESYIFDDTEMLNPVIATMVTLDESWTATEQQGDLPEEVTINCEINYRVRSGTTVYKLAEKENVSFTIPLENLPLGYVDEAVAGNLEDKVDHIKELQDQIKKLEGVNYFFGTICTIATLVTVILQVLVMAKIALLVIANIVYALIVGQAGPNQADETVYIGFYFMVGCYVIGNALWAITYYIWNPPGYLVTGPTPGTVPRIVCGFYTCKLAQANKLVKIAPLYARFFGADSKKLSGGSYTFYWQADDAQNDWEEQGDTSLTMNNEGEIEYDTPAEGTEPGTRRSFYPEGNAEREKQASMKGKGDKTNYPFANWGSQYNYDPQRSIYTAYSTGCVPMIIYNMKKLRQLECMRARCIADRAAKGFDTEVCEEQFDIRSCLYYEGAAYKLLGEDYYSHSTRWKQYVWLFSGELQVMLTAATTKAVCFGSYGRPQQGFSGQRQMDWLYISIFLMFIFPLALLNFAKSGAIQKGLAAPFFDGPLDYGSKTNVGCIGAAGGYQTFKAWAGVPCDLMLATTFAVDTGESALFKASWDVKKLFDKLEGNDWCANIEDVVPEEEE